VNISQRSFICAIIFKDLAAMLEKLMEYAKQKTEGSAEYGEFTMVNPKPTMFKIFVFDWKICPHLCKVKHFRIW